MAQGDVTGGVAQEVARAGGGQLGERRPAGDLEHEERLGVTVRDRGEVAAGLLEAALALPAGLPPEDSPRVAARVAALAGLSRDSSAPLPRPLTKTRSSHNDWP